MSTKVNEVFVSKEYTGDVDVFRYPGSRSWYWYQKSKGMKTLFEINGLAKRMGDEYKAGMTRQEHRSLIMLACSEKPLHQWFEEGDEDG